MNNIIKNITISFCIIFLLILVGCETNKDHSAVVNKSTGVEDRAFWVKTMIKIADPVLTNLSNNTLKANMPLESKGKRIAYSHLEAVGRLFCGIAPWLELGPDETSEGKLRNKYLQLILKGIRNAVNPEAPDYLVFGLNSGGNEARQPLVDAAFFAQGLIYAPTQVWGKLDNQTKKWVITELKRSRQITPWNNNWLLFASMIEAALLEFTGECDLERLMLGVKRFRDDWYKGDGWYGDGKEFHMDYYNSYVIHPMLTDVLIIMKKHNLEGADFLNIQLERLARYAVQQERFISPEGTFPVVGRSITYRFGAFHALGKACLMDLLRGGVKPEQVRCALTAVMHNQMKLPDNFDSKGWLKVGFTGGQISMSESYINTGSVYLCVTGMVSLGLPAEHPFWSEPYAEWTNLKAWNGIDVEADKALKN